MAGLTTTDLTNPVLRGSFIINKLMCRNLIGADRTQSRWRRIRTAARRPAMRFGFHSAKPTARLATR